MFIPSSAVTDWRDLQDKVCQLFREMGYHTETERVVDLGGRGKKKIDVYIRDDRASVNQIMLAECKWWASSVPQDVVHSMQTVMHNSGANTGFIISKEGFQKGAREAARSTNIHLLTWEELQHTFGKQWLAAQADRLAPVVAEMRGIDSSHLDQWETMTTIHNNMFFRSQEDWATLLDLLTDMRIAQFAAMAQPKQYDQRGPITVLVYEGFPGTVKNKYSSDELRLESVRAFYIWLIPWAQSLVAKYHDFWKQSQRAFDCLPEEKQDEARKRALAEMEGETPIRVFRKIVGDSEYFALLKKLRDGRSISPKRP